MDESERAQQKRRIETFWKNQDIGDQLLLERVRLLLFALLLLLLLIMGGKHATNDYE